MTDVNLADYKNLYIESLRESIKSLSLQYDKLSTNPLDKEALGDLHIASHSLRGRSQVMGFENIADSSANIEKISNDILNGIGQVDDNFLTIVRKSLSELSLELAQLEGKSI